TTNGGSRNNASRSAQSSPGSQQNARRDAQKNSRSNPMTQTSRRTETDGARDDEPIKAQKPREIRYSSPETPHANGGAKTPGAV
ncbi:MAG TPA: hypothetical protein VHM25_09915, partial [Polyangiaceae bacterium]|nr:hypothetical protein [Polyangiaceae bacterium]